MIEVLFFASLRERLGCERISLELPQGAQTIEALKGCLSARGEAWAAALDPAEPLMAARNEELCSLDTIIQPGDRVALFPPVTGG